jgi:Tfp pilus assembly protein PilF
MRMNVKLIRWAVFLGLATTSSVWAADKSAQGEADLAHNTGKTYLEQGRADLAAEQFKKALDADSKNFLACKGLGIALAKLTKYKEAEKVQRKCLETAPDFADLHNDLGTTLILSGRREEARKEWLLAFSSPFNPSPDQTAANLAGSFLEDGNYDEATRWFQVALQKDPKSSLGQTGLASTLVAQNRIDEAIVMLQKAVGTGKAVSSDPDLLFALCDAYYKAGRFSEARTQCEAIFKIAIASPAAKQAADLLKRFPK